MEELVHSVKEIGLLQPIVVRRLEQDKYELVMGERRWRATQQAGLDHDPRDRARHLGRRDAPRRAAGEPAPQPAEPARRGGRLPADARRLRLHPGSPRHPHRSVAAADLQHAPAAEAAGLGPAPRRRRRSVRRARPRAPRPPERRRDRAPRPAHRRRGPLGPHRRRDRCPGRHERRRPDARHAAATSRSPRAWSTWPTGSPTASKPASRSTSARPRARSPSSSRPWTTSNASSP